MALMSGAFTSPAEIARETLRQLAVERLAPTPDNFRTLYHRIAGTLPDDVFPARTLGAIVAELPRSSPQALRVVHDFEAALAHGQWPALRETLSGLVRMATETQPAWGALIRELVDGLEKTQSGHDEAARFAALQRVLAGVVHDNAVLFARLRGLVNDWARPDRRRAARDADTAAVAAPTAGGLAPALARLLRRGMMPIASANPRITAELEQLAASLEQADGEEAIATLPARIDSLAGKLEWLGEDQRAIRDTLLGLLRLVVNNIGELVIEDGWLHGQIAVIGDCFDGPLDIRKLDEIECRLREVIAKQSHLKRHLNDAQLRLQTMLAGFLGQLSELGSTAGAFHESLGRRAREIAAARDIGELSGVVEAMLRETQEVQQTTSRTKADLEDLKTQVEQANQRIESLQRELDETSELVRHDALTGALNRKGIDEALQREIARCHRRSQALCLALLDIDGFKQVNDTYGHKVGDDALRHLAEVVRDSLRPQDSVGRYGGEEFLIVLPEASVDNAVSILARLQRELTRRYFLADNQRLLITFSAGIASLTDAEDAQAAIDRADQAMYAAKRAGKNRVLVAA